MTKAKLIDYVVRAVFLGVAVVAFWLWSGYQVEKRVQAECSLQYSQAEIDVLKIKQAEVKNVEVQKAVIHSRPNASRDWLLQQMRAGQL